MSPITSRTPSIESRLSRKRTTTNKCKQAKNAIQDSFLTKLTNYITTGSISLIFLLCPIFFTGTTAQGIGFEKLTLFYFLTVIATFSLIIGNLAKKQFVFKHSIFGWAILGILISIIISTLTSINTSESFWGSYRAPHKGLGATLVFLLFFYTISNNLTIQKAKSYFWFLVTSIILTIFYSALQLIGFFVLPFAFTHNVLFQPLGTFSALGIFLSAAVPLLTIALAYFHKIHPNAPGYVAAAARSFIGYALFISAILLLVLGGFSPLIVTAIASAVVIIFAFSQTVKTKNIHLFIPVIIFLSVLSFLTIGKNFQANIIELPTEISLSRSASWNIAKQSLAENPLFGSGPSTFVYNFGQFKNASLNLTAAWNTRFNTSTGIWFEIMANLGILGILAFLLFGIACIIKLGKIIISKDYPDDTKIITMALFSAMLSLFIGASFYAVNIHFTIWFILIGALAIGMVIINDEKIKKIQYSFQEKNLNNSVIAVGTVLISIAFILSLFFGIKRYSAETIVLKALSSQDSEEKITMLKKVIKRNSSEHKYLIQLAQSYAQLGGQYLQSGDNDSAINYFQNALKYADKAVKQGQLNAETIESIAVLYEGLALVDANLIFQTEALYTKLGEIEPVNPAVDIKMGKLAVAKTKLLQDENDIKTALLDAIKYYDAAIAKKPNLATAYYLKSNAHERLSEIDKALESAKISSQLEPSNITYYFNIGRLLYNKGLATPSEITNTVEDPQIDDGGNIAPNTDNLTVQAQTNNDKTGKNANIELAETIFKELLYHYPGYLDVKYSLAALYLSTGENANAKLLVTSLLDTLQNEDQKNTIREQFKEVL